MNHGFFSFPSLLKDNPLIELQEFDTSGTFVIPSFARRLYVLLIGAGGSGGGGASYASFASSCGGGGGGGSKDGVNSGAGGRGGDGYVAIFCYK